MNEYFELAVRLAEEAPLRGELPVGAVLVKDGKVIAAHTNETEIHQSFFKHAEFICMEEASKIFGTKYLSDCDLYLTLEPCQLCFHAAKLCRIRAIYYLIPSPTFGISGKGFHDVLVEQVEGQENLKRRSESALKDFFKRKRSPSLETEHHV